MKLFAILKLAARYVADFTVANIEIAKLLLSPKMEIAPGTIDIPTEVESPGEILALSNLITFTPGTLALEIEPGERVRVHFLDASPEAATAIRERLEKPLLEITRQP